MRRGEDDQPGRYLQHNPEKTNNGIHLKAESSRRGVCVCVFSSHSFWTSSSLDVPAGVTQEDGHTGFLIHLLSAVRALIFLARRIQPFLSLVDREVEFCVLTIESFSTRWAFLCRQGWMMSLARSSLGWRPHQNMFVR